MYLMPYGVGKFINADHICWVDFSDKGSVLFGVVGDIGCAMKVEVEFNSIFLNHLQALNGNIYNIESSWRELNT